MNQNKRLQQRLTSYRSEMKNSIGRSNTIKEDGALEANVATVACEIIGGFPQIFRVAVPNSRRNLTVSAPGLHDSKLSECHGKSS